jgi:hypothetical protein
MSLNPSANKVQSMNLMNTVLQITDSSGQTIADLINIFLITPSKPTYDPLVSAVFTGIATMPANSRPKFMLSIDNGLVAIDNTKPISKHEWANVLTGSVDNNQNTRPEMLQALLSKNGTGFSRRRFENDSRLKCLYYALRMGETMEEALGIVRIGIQIAI